ncbi:MAG: Multidomain signal transduction protein including CheB-like methylesterase, CheR-like methyltransferase and BaeS-like histidine kinase [uncultured Ramlibacter sp.]|uniref:histidine kinase n=1 Tax=uncultured Ramlibacter sp. TaxID=260755 RepID=A0A6J4PL04_9BURK|nr:MAG: Multidomain signal transduction protein including CheB-like methylesterase, CheR-like methyltransferase and BaeS-like histidine kinase [uncultured Ramlibacter sp.]
MASSVPGTMLLTPDTSAGEPCGTGALQQPWRVLLLHESGDVRALLRRLLQQSTSRRCHVFDACNLAEGVAALRDGTQWTLAVAGARLPGGGAQQLLQQLADAQGGMAVPVLVLAEEPSLLAPALLRAGAQDVIGRDALSPASFTTAAEHAVYRWQASREHLDREASLRDRNAQLESILAAAPVGIAVFDCECRYVRVNPELAGINGLSPDEHVGRPVHEVIPGLAPRVADLIRHVFESGETVRDLEFSGDTPSAPGVPRHWISGFYPIRGADRQVQAVGCWVTEVTERRRALQQLHLRDRAIAASDTGVLMADATQPGRPLTFASPGFERMTGYSADEVMGRSCRFLQGPETDPAAAQRIREALQAGEPVRVTLLNHRKDGTPFWNDLSISPVFDDHGVLAHWVGILNDVTAQRQDQSALEASRLKLEMGIQAAGLVMADIDYRTNENHISAELARLLEMGDHDMVVPRQAIFDRIHPEDRGRYLDAIAATTDPAGGGHLAIDVRALLPSGTVRWVHIRLQVIFTLVDGKLVADRGICAARDVTAEMVAQRQLRAAQRLTESVIEGAGALVYAKDLEGRYILSNQAWRNQMGLAPEQAKGITDEKIFGPELAAVLRASDAQALESGEPVLVQEKVTFQGRQVTYRSSKFPLYDDAGRIYAVCGVSTDITDVVEADRRKDEFIATLAHELRNPLAPIRNGLEILRRTELPPLAARTRGMMERQLTHMVRLVDDLLDVSRINRDKVEIRPEPLTLDQIVEHALEATQPVIEAAGHRLEVQLPSPPARVQGDLTRLAQVVSNLLNNAAKYTPRGGHIRVTGAVESDSVLLEVADNGVGIAAEMLPRVFDLFSQVDRSIERTHGGLGIGLWLVKKLVELHRGTITAHSDGLGRGSTFCVRLPLM